ncbi:hypothetical protein JXA48_03755 [Candidatus Woesearchaeota archaeon]|nr:hypothetical protein [Candidatus Woesearchaeota archaeon]
MRPRKILITGEAGRGKTTLANELSKKLNIKQFSTDDFLWKKKYSEQNSRNEACKLINKKVYSQKQWIVEGTSKDIIAKGLEDSDIIVYMKHKTLVGQYYWLIKRHFTRDYETKKELVEMLIHVTRKRYNIGAYYKNPQTKDVVKKYQNKIITIKSLKEKNKFLKTIN